MITCETPLRSVQSQRRGLEVLWATRPDLREYIRGAIATLDWVEFGSPSPLEGYSPELVAPLERDSC